MNDTTKNFWEAFAQSVPETTTVSYRLYYNDQGQPLFYTMEDLPGDYIEIDKDEFAKSSPHVRVVNGKIVSTLRSSITKKLVPSNTGTSCHPGDVGIVVSDKQSNIKWNRKTYESC